VGYSQPVNSRILLVAFVGLVALAVAALGVMRWQGAQAFAEVTPVGEVRWDGYVIEHDQLTEEGESAPNLNHMRVSRDGALVSEWRVFVVDGASSETHAGFFGGLNADSDPELELVLCERGVVRSFAEPDRATGEVVTRDGSLAAPRVHEVCETSARAGRVTCAACCAVPIAVPVFIALLIFARRERTKEARLGRTEF
jgi:hypothetical protein